MGLGVVRYLVISKFERLFVWLGGLAFVVSLATCAWWFVVVLARTHPRSGSAVLFDALLLAVFSAHHSIFARDQVKAWLTRVVPRRLLRSLYVWMASALLVLVCVLWRPVGGEVYVVTGWRAVAHAAVQLAGIWIIAQSVRAIDALELAGIREQSDTASLQITGPYRWVRHPLYFGWMLAVFGPAHMTGDRLAFAVITTVYLVVAIPWEERSLLRAFGEAYERYKREVPRRMIPYVY